MKVEMRRINIEIVKRRLNKKYDIKNKILKTLTKNQNQAPAVKSAITLLYKKKNLKLSQNRQTNFCSVTGRFKAYQKYHGLSRHSLKRFSLHGQAQNMCLTSR